MSITSNLLGAAGGIASTGLLVNWLAQRWQHRNWLNQQRFLGSEKSYEILRSHSEEIAKLAAQRLSSMYRLVKSIEISLEEMEERRKIYSDEIDKWNGSINFLYSKTTMLIDFNMTRRLENEIHNKFYEAGRIIERAIREKRRGEETIILRSTAISKLDQVQGYIINFNRDLIRIVLNQQAATYYGTELKYCDEDLSEFSNFQLIKALFVTRVDSYSILLTSYKLGKPALRRN